MLNSQGVPAEKTVLARPVEIVIIAVGLLLCVLLYALYGAVTRIVATQEDGVVRGYKNRAAVCNLINANGVAMPDECKEAVIKPYLDAHITPGSSVPAVEAVKARELLCTIVMQQNRVLPADKRLSIPASMCPE